MKEIETIAQQENRDIYVQPAVECISVCIENGFAASPNVDQPDSNDLGEL